MKESFEPIIVEQEFDTTPEKLWDAITQLDQMRLWFIETIPDFKPEVGFEVKFNVSADSRDFLHIWKVVEVINQNKISFDWTFEGIKGRSRTTFELLKIDARCKLTLTAEVLESFPDDIPEFRRESGVKGWKYFINERLVDYFKSK
jgi:uncharacterized protein YndB with AHSA1/START domain